MCGQVVKWIVDKCIVDKSRVDKWAPMKAFSVLSSYIYIWAVTRGLHLPSTGHQSGPREHSGKEQNGHGSHFRPCNASDRGGYGVAGGHTAREIICAAQSAELAEQ